MTHIPINPFRYGNPVPPDLFIGREGAKRTIFSRLNNEESTAITGRPHMGKSSLLRYVSSETSTIHTSLCIDIDCQLLPVSYMPRDLWRKILNHIEGAILEEPIQQQIIATHNSLYDAFALERLFKLFARSSKRIILLMDEFDTLLYNGNFNNAEFFGALRSLATRTNSLILVTASRISVAEMNRHFPLLGSPFFNLLVEERLVSLSPVEVDQLLERYLAGTGITFSAQERAYIQRATGGHPFLVQIAAAALFDALADGMTAWTAQVDRSLLQRAAAYFEDTWRHLGPEAQQTLLALAQVERDASTSTANPHLDLHWLSDSELSDLIEPSYEGILGWRISAQSFSKWITKHAYAAIQFEPKKPPIPERTRLLRLLIEHFNDSELRDLYFDMEIDYESLPGDEKKSKARELIRYCERVGQVDKLVNFCRQHRPKLPW